MELQNRSIKNAYVVGIKGSGVVALAGILIRRGVQVSGSDTAERFFTDQILAELNIPVKEGFSLDNLPDQADVVIHSTAYTEENNLELRELRQRKVPMMSYPEALAALFNEKFGLAVCGTHGKTTTTALLGMALFRAGVDPTVVVGSRVNNWAAGSIVGDGEFFGIEADEYQNKLALYQPKAVILTSVDYDHPDFFPTVTAYQQAFRDFVAKIPKVGNLIVWGDSAETLAIAKAAHCQVTTYGFGKDNTYVITQLRQLADQENQTVQTFHVLDGERDLGQFQIGLVGKHNVLNAASVIALADRLGINLEKVGAGIKDFQGVARRFELVGVRNGALLIDDYAHHPEEIKATLAGARERYPEKNIITVFHPHTFSRTAALLQEFAQSFDHADKVYVLDIYGSVRESQGAVSSQDLVRLINRYVYGKAEHLPTVADAVATLSNSIGTGDVVIAMGAGNVWEVVDKLKE